MSDLTGKIIGGRYRVIEFIGRGGMAEVYRVWDSRRNTALAMKLIHPDLALDRAFLRRFHREAETLAHLQHPNIVRFYGLEQDGEHVFILMDFVEGKSLKQLIFSANGPLPLQRVVDTMRQLCQALQFAHYEGFVHADVKPGNVLIDNAGRVMLNDFGIAQMAQTATTSLGGAGTPAYMSPEQARGGKPTLQSDIYALGILLYEMLTGERPFNGDNSSAKGTADDRVRWEQIHLPPPSPRDSTPHISAALEEVVLKALAKDASQRYQTALELWEAVEGAGGAMASEAREGSSAADAQVAPEQTTRRQTSKAASQGPGRQRAALPALTILGVIGLVGLLAVLWRSTGLTFPLTGSESTPTATQAATRTVVSPSVTPSPRPTTTSVPSATSTPGVPVVTAKEVAVNCRVGPGTEWEAVSALTLGAVAEIVGKNSELDYSWWYIKDPLNPGLFCWVAFDVTNAAGNLPVIPVVPTPTALVTKVTVRSEVTFTACGAPNAVAFSGRLTTNGPTEVRFQWEVRGDEELTTSPQSLTFDAFGTREVQYPGDYGTDCGNYSIRLHVLSPNDDWAAQDFSVAP